MMSLKMQSRRTFGEPQAVTVRFRTEFFNLPNFPNFGNPAANISVPSTAGSIFGAGDLRQIQFGLKVLF